MAKCLLWSMVLLCASGCAPRQAATTWGYSHWYEQGGGSLGEFEQQQRSCLAQIGAATDAASITPNSPQEDSFIECMNAAGWCTNAFGCNKPGA